MIPPRILVAGVGNIFLGDDGFGVEVAQRLARTELPEGVRVVDFGIRGLDLTYALLDDYESVILVDATPRGGTPGTLYIMQPTIDNLPDAAAGLGLADPHGMDPVKVLRLAASMGGKLDHMRLVGCEPVPIQGEDDMRMELSEPVCAAVDHAVEVIREMVADLLAHGESGPSVNYLSTIRSLDHVALDE